MTRQSVLALLVFVAFLFSCGTEEVKKTPKKERTFKVKTVPVEKGEFFTKYRTSGYFEAVHRLKVKPEVSGKVERLFAEEGDKVNRGKPLLKIEDSLYRKAYEETLWKLKQAQRELENIRAIYNRRKKLFKKELISREEYEEFKTKLESARAKVESLKALVERKKIELSKTLLKSPIEGYVVKRFVEVGDYITPQREAYELVKPHPLRFVFKVPQEVVRKLKLNQNITVRLEDKEITAPVTYISPTADRGRLFTVKALIEDPEGIKPGTYGEASFNYRKVEGVSLPEQAVQLSQRQSFVWIVRNGRSLKLPVQVLTHEEGKVVVSGDFKEGDRVIVEGLLFLFEGAKVVEE